MTDAPPSTQPAPPRKRKYGGPNGYGHRENLEHAKLIADAPHVRHLIQRVGATKPIAKLGARTRSLRPFGPVEVFDQGQTSACVGNGFAGGITCSLGAAGTPLETPPSQLHIYTLARCIDRGDPNVALQDEGSDPASAVLGIATYGITLMGDRAPDGRNSDCDPNTINQEPKLLELESAAVLKFKGVYRLPLTDPDLADLIVQTIDAGFAINFATFVGEKEEDWDPSTGPLGAPDRSDPSGGGHDLYIDGYEIDAAGNLTVFGANSWGKVWGENGYFSANIDFVRGWSVAFVLHLEKVDP